MKPVGIFGNHLSERPDIKKKKTPHFIGCLLAEVIRSKLISVQLDHPVASYSRLAKSGVVNKVIGVQILC